MYIYTYVNIMFLKPMCYGCNSKNLAYCTLKSIVLTTAS